MASKSLPSLRWEERAQAQKGCQWGNWVPRRGDCGIHRLVGDGNVLICILALINFSCAYMYKLFSCAN